MLQGKYIEYTPDITLEVFSKVWDVLIKAGWKSIANQTVMISYDDFKKKRFFSYASDPMFFSVYDIYLANDVKVTVDQLLGFDNWCIKITPEVKEVLQHSDILFALGYDYTIGAYYGQTQGKEWGKGGQPKEYHTLITIEQLKEKVGMKSFTLPPRWYVVVTEENREVLQKWRWPNDNYHLEPGKIVGIPESGDNGKFELNHRGHNPKGSTTEFGDFEITYEQFKKYVLKEGSFVLPSQWYISLNQVSRETLEKWTHNSYNEILGYVTNTKNWNRNRSSECTEISFEQFEKYVFKIEPFVLPEKWCVEVTEKTRETLLNWRDTKCLDKTSGYCYCLGYASGTFRKGTSIKGYYEERNDIGYPVITFEQFKRYVLGETDVKLESVKTETAPKPTFKGCYLGKSSDLVSGKKIIDALLKEGGNNPIERDGTSTNYYFIDHNGDIDYEPNVPSGYTLMQLEGEAAPMKVAPTVKPQPEYNKQQYYKGAMLGNPNRGGEVLEFFRQRGATGVNGFNGKASAYYYMDDSGNMKCHSIGLPDGYIEVFLPETSSLLPKPIEIDIVDKSAYFPKVEEVI